MQFDNEGILEMVNGKRQPNRKGWHPSDCPYCGKKEHFGVNFTNKGSYSCFKCGEKGSLYAFLKHWGRLDLVDNYIEPTKVVNPFTAFKKPETVLLESDKVLLPLGFKRTDWHEYLEDRGFTEEQYELYHVGTTDKLSYLKDYVIFSVVENGECKGWVARHTKQQKKSENIVSLAAPAVPLQKGNTPLRYQNSKATDFEKLLFGIDELTPETKTVYLVEGIFDKTNVDKQLKLFNNTEVKCLATFGKKISEYQILKLLNKGIENVVFLYDPDALKESKAYSLELYHKFKKVEACFIGGTKDCGDMTKEELHQILNLKKNALNFYFSHVGLAKKLL